MDAEELYKQAQTAIKAGSPDTAAQFLARVLRLNPRHEKAWMSLAYVVEEKEHAIECLTRVLALNRGNRQAQKLLREVQEEAAREEMLREEQGRMPRLGKYLLEARAITTGQLKAGLAAQRSASAAGHPKRLGEILVKQGSVSPKEVQKAAAQQFEDFFTQFED